MPSRTRLTLRSCIAPAIIIASIVPIAPAYAADQGSVQIVAIAPAFCRVMSPPRPLASPDVSPVSGTAHRACNTVNEAQITAQVSNLDGAVLRLGGANVAVSANGVVTFSAEQLAAISDLHVVNERPGEARAQIAVELTITPQ
jgi:hypothetical protein